MKTLSSYVCGDWKKGEGSPSTLVNPATEEALAETSARGVDIPAALAYARDEGGPALRALSFAERGALLLAMSRAIHEHRDELLTLAMANGGNTRSDAKFDIDGASGTLAYYAGLGKELGDRDVLVDGDLVQLSRGPRFVGGHVWLPRRGVAVHINAFNFPAWGLGEKAACAVLAGMPVVCKPATSTALVAHRITEIFVEKKILPAGVFSLICGSAHDIADHLAPEDVVAFTGGSSTAVTLRNAKAVTERNVRLNIEADSLNAAVLGSDVEPGSDTFQMFAREVVKDITQKTGQKCTAIRRVFVHEDRIDDVAEELAARLGEFVIGDPQADGVTMGPVATKSQQRDVLAGIERLTGESTRVLGSDAVTPKGAPDGKGFFVPTTLFVQKDASKAKAVHEHEVFGPCATLIAYKDADHASAEVRRGGGGLVSTIYSDDKDFTKACLFGIAAHHGRVVLGSEKIAEQTPGPGTVLPQSVHGGPGRAGGGEELGGLRGISFYSQRTAVQGSRPILESLLSLK